MRPNAKLFALLITFGLLGWARPALACSCMTVGPACQSYWKTDAVFDATVVSIGPLSAAERLPGGGLSFSDRSITLEVRQSWKGAQPGRLEITTGPTGGGCGFTFEQGERYLIFARLGAGGRLTTSICSLTQKFNGTGPAADFLASLDAPARGGRVFGTVRTIRTKFEHGLTSSEVPTEAAVKLSGAGLERTTTSSGGRYEFNSLPEGAYRIEVDIPFGHQTYSATRDVQIPSRRACAEENYSFAPAGRIAGQLVGPDGRGLSGVRVEVTSPEARPHPDYGLSTFSARTNADGSFDIQSLPPGRYIVGVNLPDLPSTYNPYARTVYPDATSDPHVIDVALGQTVDLGTWHMPPPLAIVHVAGIVTRQDGRPAAGVYVGAWDRTGNPIERARGAGGTTSGADGRFVLELREGRVYTFMARGSDSKLLRISSPRIQTGAGLPALVRIVILDE